MNDTNFAFTFSYGRALQQSALKTWAKNIKDARNVQDAFEERAKMKDLRSRVLNSQFSNLRDIE